MYNTRDVVFYIGSQISYLIHGWNLFIESTSPLAFNERTLRVLQVILSQFNASPLVCTLVGSSRPGIEMFVVDLSSLKRQL